VLIIPGCTDTELLFRLWHGIYRAVMLFLLFCILNAQWLFHAGLSKNAMIKPLDRLSKSRV